MSECVCVRERGRASASQRGRANEEGKEREKRDEKRWKEGLSGPFLYAHLRV